MKSSASQALPPPPVDADAFALPEIVTPYQSKNMKMKSRIAPRPGDLLPLRQSVQIHLHIPPGAAWGRADPTPAHRAAREGVDQQHRDRHRPDAARHRRDRARRPRRPASKSTSPTRPSSARLMPTSITIAPGLTISAPTSRGDARPRQRARRPRGTPLPGHGCASGTAVTVAFAASSSAATRLADQLRAPEHDCAAPSRSTPAWRSSSITPDGVQGTTPRRALGEQAGVDRGKPVDVLGRVDRRDQRSGSRWSGRGSWTRMP